MRHIFTTAVVLFALGPGIAPTPVAAQAPPAPQPERVRVSARVAEAAASQLFHVTLVAASRQNGDSGQGDLPKAVAQALDDIQDFLPYKGYRVVDSALVRASRELHARLTGPQGSRYQADATFSATGSGDSFLVERFELRRTPRIEDVAREMGQESGHPAVAPMAPQPNLTASFRIDRGETVVVGSSRLDGGDEALIVLLTAVP